MPPVAPLYSPDEPTGNLDRATGDEVVRLLEALNARGVTHEMEVFEWLGDCRHPRFRQVLTLVNDAA